MCISRKTSVPFGSRLLMNVHVLVACCIKYIVWNIVVNSTIQFSIGGCRSIEIIYMVRKMTKKIGMGNRPLRMVH
jgi:hypothetical protein